jgi:hypothetical protein
LITYLEFILIYFLMVRAIYLFYIFIMKLMTLIISHEVFVFDFILILYMQILNITFVLLTIIVTFRNLLLLISYFILLL